jgi:hypothetical protein
MKRSLVFLLDISKARSWKDHKASWLIRYNLAICASTV